MCSYENSAAATIERENPLVKPIIVPEGSEVVENFRCDRVWVWVDKDGIVYTVPVIDGKSAAATIERENPLVKPIIVPEGSGVIENFRCDRVWVWVDKYGIVYIVPVIG
uniref:Uncharacterized protein n=1 Tax=Salix viminalis TaxID=40686 RepID=A0A6N2N3C0_SALVM